MMNEHSVYQALLSAPAFREPGYEAIIIAAMRDNKRSNTFQKNIYNIMISPCCFVCSLCVCADDCEEVEQLTEEIIKTVERICGETIQF